MKKIINSDYEYKIIDPDLSVKYFIFDINDTGFFKINEDKR